MIYWKNPIREYTIYFTVYQALIDTVNNQSYTTVITYKEKYTIIQLSKVKEELRMKEKRNEVYSETLRQTQGDKDGIICNRLFGLTPFLGLSCYRRIQETHFSSADDADYANGYYHSEQ